MSLQIRYSIPKFRETILIAVGLTAMVAGLSWMMLLAFGNPHARLWTALTALVFFGFISAPALLKYVRNETVLAILPTGLAYARYTDEPLPWESIRDVVVRQTENDYQLDVYLWKRQGAAATAPDLTIELAPLDAGPAAIVEALGKHVRVRFETGQVGSVAG